MNQVLNFIVSATEIPLPITKPQLEKSLNESISSERWIDFKNYCFQLQNHIGNGIISSEVSEIPQEDLFDLDYLTFLAQIEAQKLFGQFEKKENNILQVA